MKKLQQVFHYFTLNILFKIQLRIESQEAKCGEIKKSPEHTPDCFDSKFSFSPVSVVASFAVSASPQFLINYCLFLIKDLYFTFENVVVEI